MDVVLLHDPAAPPFDAWTALTEAGHRLAAHGTFPPGLDTFLSAMTWGPQAFVVDHRGDAAAAARTLAWLAADPRGRHARLVAAWPPADAALPDGVHVARDVDDVLAALDGGDAGRAAGPGDTPTKS